MIRDPATHNPSNGVGDANGGDYGGNGAFTDSLLGCITCQAHHSLLE